MTCGTFGDEDKYGNPVVACFTVDGHRGVVTKVRSWLGVKYQPYVQADGIWGAQHSGPTIKTAIGNATKDFRGDKTLELDVARQELGWFD